MRFRIIILFLFSLPVYSQVVTRYALLVGVGQYPKESKWPRLHADEDAKRIKATLKKQGFLEGNIRMLLNENGTYENIRLALKKLSDQAEPQDQIILYFGGHAQQVTDVSGDEVDKLDEAFVPYDALPTYKGGYYEGKSHLLDDELSRWISLLTNKVTRYGAVFILYDAGISTEKGNMAKGPLPPFKISSWFKTGENIEARPKDNEWLDFSYSEEYNQIVVLDHGDNARLVSEIQWGPKETGSPLVLSYTRKLSEKGTRRYRDLKTTIEAVFKSNNRPPVYRLDGAAQMDMLKSSWIAADSPHEETTEPAGPFRIFSIVIGVSNYLEINPLRFGHKDAGLFSDMLTRLYQGKFRKEDQFVFLDSNATVKPIIDAFEMITAQAGENDRIYFYFAGHGDVENLITKKAHLLLFDSPAHVYKSGGTLRVDDLKDYFAQWTYKKALVYLVVDACKSGKLAGGSEGQTQTINNINELQVQSARLLSCQPNENSVESTDFGGGHGAFTYYMVKGVEGQADADKDKKVSIGEIKTFLVDSVSGHTHQAQNPMVQGNSRLTFFPVSEPLISAYPDAGLKASSLEKGASPAEDSLKSLWCRELRKLLASGHFIAPEEQSAKKMMERIANTWPMDRSMLSGLRQEIAGKIVLKSQRLINQYIEGNEQAVRETYFAEGAKEMDFLLELIEVDNPLYFTYLARKYFFEGRSLLPRLVDNDRKRYQLNAAVENLKKSLKYEPEGAHNYNALGRLQQVNRQFDAAIASYKQAIYLAPQWKFPINNLASAYDEYAFATKSKAGLYDSAVYYYQAVIGIDPNYAVAYSNLGKTYANRENDAMAKVHYLRSIFLDPGRTEAYQNLGDIYRSEQKWDSAAYYLRQGLAIQNDQADLITNLGNVFFDQSYTKPEIRPELLRKARTQYARALELDSLCKEAKSGMGNYYWEIQKYDSAAFFYQKCIQLDSNNTLFLNYYIESLTRSGKDKEAEKLAIRLSLKYPNDATNWFDLGVFAVLKQNYPLAEKRFNKAISLGLASKSAFEDDPMLNNFRKSSTYARIRKMLK